jgi:pyruvate dehydrogenase E1 component beta subunit
MAEQSTIEAIRDALRDEMARDDAVYLLGEDIALGGPFGATRGLAEEFGPGRVLNTPISEGTVMGLGIGAAIAGFRPVVEIMFIDFITLAMDQLVNHAAKLNYMSGGQIKVPLTVRVQAGAFGGAGAHHSQSLEAWFVHVPGVKIVMPSNPRDAKGLLKAAIRDDHPVLFIESRALYRSRGEVEAGDYTVPLGKATIRRQGSDVTIVALARAVDHALAAADRLAESGIAAEVIDPRTLTPLDLETITDSVRKTGRLVIAHEAIVRGGAGAEIAARVQEAVFYDLDSPIARVGAPFTPAPAGKFLEAKYVPGSETIVAAARRVVNRS